MLAGEGWLPIFVGLGLGSCDRRESVEENSVEREPRYSLLAPRWRWPISTVSMQATHELWGNTVGPLVESTVCA